VPQASRRPVARACLDGTERRSHLGGQAGAHLRARFEQDGWIVTCRGGRGVRFTPAGRSGLRDLLGLDLPELAA
jgi:hypothetical protein